MERELEIIDYMRVRSEKEKKKEIEERIKDKS